MQSQLIIWPRLSQYSTTMFDTKIIDEPILLSLRDNAWVYKGEGNTNLVISLTKEKIIIRFHKTETDILCENGSLKVDSEKAQREVFFWRCVLIPHLGQDYFKPPLFGVICDEEIRELNEILAASRPKSRLRKSICSGFVSIYPDYTFVNSGFPLLNKNESEIKSKRKNINSEESTFCVEIKPKQGWLHPLDRQKKCTFCLNQFLKIEKGVVVRRSEYCPLDLFSGNKLRMKKAIKCLLDSPQNNFKIFQDGHVVFSDNSNCSYIDVLQRWFEPEIKDYNDHERIIEKFCELLYNALVKELIPDDSISYLNSLNLSESKDKYCSQPVLSEFNSCDWTADQLPRSCVLYRILSLQKLQLFDFKTVYQIYKSLPKDIDDYYYIHDLLNSTNSMGAIEAYLLATTAKDCSILISFQRVNKLLMESNHLHIEDCDGVPYYMNIGVLDLDPKPLSSIQKHYHRDINILSAYLRSSSKNYYVS